MKTKPIKITDEMRLQFEPFGGDESDVRMRTVKMVTVRKRHICFGSFNPDNNPKKHFVKSGERARFETAMVDGEWNTSYHCLTCIDREIRENY